MAAAFIRYGSLGASAPIFTLKSPQNSKEPKKYLAQIASHNHISERPVYWPLYERVNNGKKGGYLVFISVFSCSLQDGQSTFFFRSSSSSVSGLNITHSRSLQ